MENEDDLVLSCLGEYRPDGRCDECPLVLLCIDIAMEDDGYYDELARREEEEWGTLQSRTDARIRRAMGR